MSEPGDLDKISDEAVRKYEDNASAISFVTSAIRNDPWRIDRVSQTAKWGRVSIDEWVASLAQTCIQCALVRLQIRLEKTATGKIAGARTRIRWGKCAHCGHNLKETKDSPVDTCPACGKNGPLSLPRELPIHKLIEKARSRHAQMTEEIRNSQETAKSPTPSVADSSERGSSENDGSINPYLHLCRRIYTDKLLDDFELLKLIACAVDDLWAVKIQSQQNQNIDTSLAMSLNALCEVIKLLGEKANGGK